MAKRKRLTAPDPSTIAAPETKSMLSQAPIGVVPKRRAPIADVAGDAATTAALQAVAAELTAAKTQGRMVHALALDAVNPNYLIRDRVTLDGEEMEVLKASLQQRGQQTPIEVVETGSGRYGLISGFRRLHALRELSRDGGAQTVLALVRQPQEASDAYTAMVEENEIRVGLSYFERANVVARAVEAKVFVSESDALKHLFASASRAKRSKIKSFLPVIRALGSHLVYPGALTERQGLALSALIAKDPEFAPRLCDRLRKAMPGSAGAEADVINRALQQASNAAADAQVVKPTPPAAKPTGVEMQTLPSGIKVQHKPGNIRITGDAVTPDVVQSILEMLRNI